MRVREWEKTLGPHGESTTVSALRTERIQHREQSGGRELRGQLSPLIPREPSPYLPHTTDRPKDGNWRSMF